MRRWIRAARVLLNAVALALVILGVPWLLVAVAGRPLPTYQPDPADVLTALQQRNVPGEFVVKALAVVMWVVWLQFAWATLWELVVNIRRVEKGHQPAPAPLVPKALHRGAARLVASMFAATVISGTAASALVPMVASMSRASTASASVVPGSAAPRPVVDRSVVERWAPPRWCVQADDTLWGIAEAALGDGSRVGEILELNPAISSPRSVRAGTVLQLPAGAAVPADRAPASDPAEDDASCLDATTVTIIEGDTLWDLSKTRIESATSDPASPASTLSYLHLVIDANPDVIEDPNLIFPGEVFTLPAIGETPLDEEVRDARPPGESPDAGTPVATAPTPAEVDASTTTTTTATTTTVPAAERAPTQVPVVTAATPAVDSQPSSDDSWFAELGVSTVLAGGLLAVYRRHRQRRAVRGVSRSRALRRLELAEGLLARATDVPLMRWAAGILYEAATFAAAHDLPGAPVVMEISPDEGVELLWDQQNHRSVGPWKVIDGGWSWQASFDDDDARVAATDVPAVVPALVTIGKRDGRDLLIDLEAFGAITVTGAGESAEGLVRSMATELGSGEDLSNAYVMVVGIDVAIADHLPRVSVRTEDEAIDHLRSIVSDQSSVMERAGMSSTFRLRGSSPIGREATVLVVRADACDKLEEIIELASPRHGVGVIILADSAITPAAIEIDASSHATLASLGLEFEPAGITATRSVEVAEVLDSVADADDEEIDSPSGAPDVDVDMLGQLGLPTMTSLATDVDASELGAAWTTGDCEQLEPRSEPGLLVRVLGAPRVEHPADLGRLDVSLIAFIACRGGSAPDEQVIDAVWNGRAVGKATVHNRLSKIRSMLSGCLPPRDKSDSTMRLTDGVTTDLYLMSQLIRSAEHESSGEAISMLRQALDFVAGPPFDAPGYEWAYTHQYHSTACELIESATLRLIDLALEAGEFALARHAAAAGLKALRLNEPIYRAKMRIEAAAGNLTGVRSVYNELFLLLDELDDGYEPSDETQRLLRQLVERRLSA